MATSAVDKSIPGVLDKLAEMASADPKSQVRSAALAYLGESGDTKYQSIIEKAIKKDQSYMVIGAGLQSLAKTDPNAALKVAESMENEKNDNIINAIGDVYGLNPNPSKLSFFEKNWDRIGVYPSFSFFENYFNVMKAADYDIIRAAIQKLNSYASNQDKSPWKRFAAVKAMHDMRSTFLDNGENDKASPITSLIETIKRNEKHDQLKMILSTQF